MKEYIQNRSWRTPKGKTHSSCSPSKSPVDICSDLLSLEGIIKINDIICYEKDNEEELAETKRTQGDAASSSVQIKIMLMADKLSSCLFSCEYKDKDFDVSVSFETGRIELRSKERKTIKEILSLLNSCD